MPTLPWTPARAVRATPADGRAARADAVVFGSRLELRAYRHLPRFLIAAMKLRREVHHSPGAFGVSLIAQPLHKTFWTLSAWADRESLESFVRTTEHVKVMRAFHDRLAGTAFVSWTRPVAELPGPHRNAKDLWHDAKERIAVSTPGGT